MKPSIIRWSLLLAIAAVSAWLNPWAGIATVLIVASACLVLWQQSRGTSSTMGSGSANEERLIHAVGQLRSHPYEGEIFGFNSRVQSDIREIIGALDKSNEATPTKVSLQTILPILVMGLLTLTNFGVILWAPVRFYQWGIIALVVLPSLTYPILSMRRFSRQ